MEGRSETGFPENEEKRVQGRVFMAFWDPFLGPVSKQISFFSEKKDVRKHTEKKDPQNENVR